MTIQLYWTFFEFGAYALLEIIWIDTRVTGAFRMPLTLIAKSGCKKAHTAILGGGSRKYIPKIEDRQTQNGTSLRVWNLWSEMLCRSEKSPLMAGYLY